MEITVFMEIYFFLISNLYDFAVDRYRFMRKDKGFVESLSVHRFAKITFTSEICFRFIDNYS